MAPYEALYGRKCQSPIFWEEGVVRFGIKRKLVPRFVYLYEIIESVGAVAYRLSLPPDMSLSVEIDQEMSYEEQPIEIVDTRVRKLWNKEILMVKVLWRNHSVEEFTWETESDMRSRIPFLFP
ncbi:uncharacterized protein LOC126668388 [Mercurialis annua]|uniref:uncharacterized protein LOC126668388 n=1 Tax=Mercurialis annua TaxID=3986 RepID=UPI002160A831|nr:uncharacterized protein LOC126668388 [Mercurialis annua]